MNMDNKYSQRLVRNSLSELGLESTILTLEPMVPRASPRPKVIFDRQSKFLIYL